MPEGGMLSLEASKPANVKACHQLCDTPLRLAWCIAQAGALALQKTSLNIAVLRL